MSRRLSSLRFSDNSLDLVAQSKLCSEAILIKVLAQSESDLQAKDYSDASNMAQSSMSKDVHSRKSCQE